MLYPAEPPHSPLSKSASPDQRLLFHRRVVLLTDGFSNPFLAKTAINLLRYRPQDIAAVLDRELSGKTSQDVFQVGGSIPIIGDLSTAGEFDSIYIGIAPPGGKLPAQWRSVIVTALQNGLDVVSGLHDFLGLDEEFSQLALTHNAQIIDVRRNAFRETATATPFATDCLRILTVGHDCSVGKMVVTLELEQALQNAGHDAKFLATGQTGIMIAGAGIPIDCVVSDFVNGAAESLVRQHESHSIVLVEGQGSISHPAFSAVTLGLLHGSAPDGLIFCYEAGRQNVKGIDHMPIPDLKRQMEALRQLANLRHPCRFIGIGVNTRNLTASAAAEEIERAQQTFGLPACDVYRDGAEKLVTAVVQIKQELAQS